ncbi:hypothetical protein Hanom_Chr12g01180201 [Helianthus anomalus]
MFFTTIEAFRSRASSLLVYCELMKIHGIPSSLQTCLNFPWVTRGKKLTLDTLSDDVCLTRNTFRSSLVFGALVMCNMC